MTDRIELDELRQLSGPLTEEIVDRMLAERPAAIRRMCADPAPLMPQLFAIARAIAVGQALEEPGAAACAEIAGEIRDAEWEPTWPRGDGDGLEGTTVRGVPIERTEGGRGAIYIAGRALSASKAARVIAIHTSGEWRWEHTKDGTGTLYDPDGVEAGSIAELGNDLERWRWTAAGQTGEAHYRHSAMMRAEEAAKKHWRGRGE